MGLCSGYLRVMETLESKSLVQQPMTGVLRVHMLLGRPSAAEASRQAGKQASKDGGLCRLASVPVGMHAIDMRHMWAQPKEANLCTAGNEGLLSSSAEPKISDLHTPSLIYQNIRRLQVLQGSHKPSEATMLLTILRDKAGGGCLNKYVGYPLGLDDAQLCWLAT